MNTSPINLQDKLSRFSDTWSPRIIDELNGQLVKLAKLDGEFLWHSHEDEDELFLVLEGSLTLKLKIDDSIQEVVLNPGELYTVPRGVEHQPIAQPNTSVLLFEPADTKHTGQHTTDRTVNDQQHI